MAGSVIIGGARTPIGKLSGAFASFSATDLGAKAIAAALERAGVAPDAVDYVYMGQVLQAGAGQTSAAASQVLSAAQELARHSESLTHEVSRFLAGVKAA